MESNTSTQISHKQQPADRKIIHLPHLSSYLRRVKAGRQRRGIRYRLEVVPILFILAKVCGENKVFGIADWVQQRSEYLIEVLDLSLKRRCLPHHSPYRRSLTEEIDAQELGTGVSE